MEQSERYPSYVVSVANALSMSSDPLSIDALVDEVRGQRPISKGVRSAVYRAIKQLYQAVPVGTGQFGWLSHLLNNNVFRHPLANDEARRGYLLLDELEHAVFFPQFFQTHRPDNRNLTIELLGGPVLRAEAAVERHTWSLRLGNEFAEWIDEQGGQGRDDIIIMVRDAVRGEYVLRLQPREARDEDVIRDRSIMLAMTAEDLVADSRRTEKALPTWELAAMLIGRGLYNDPVPPDDLHLALQRYSMLALCDGQSYKLKDADDISSRDAVHAPFSSVADEQQFRMPNWEPEEEDGRRYQPEFLNSDNADDSCQDYEEYLAQHQTANVAGSPLSHGDYHLLEAELEMLVSLEQEFGYLLTEQQTRVEELAEKLFIDPEALRNSEQDAPDEGDIDGSSYWQN